MNYKEAKQIADKYLKLLKPFCEKIEIAGSIRRKKTVVGDVEIVVIPQKIKKAVGFFDYEMVVHPSFVAIINSLKKVKGEPTGKYTQRILPEGIVLDLFIASPENWGLIFAIRTGSANFSHKVLATSWVKKGFKSINGMLHKNNIPFTIKEEIDLFKLLDLDYIEPNLRN